MEDMRKRMNIQLFAEGDGTGSAPAEVTPADATGEATEDAAQEEGVEPPKEAPKASFEELIKGEYKKDFDDKVHRIIGAKTANIKALQEEMDSIRPILDTVSRKYGVDSSDINALMGAIENDTSYFEQEAIERGMTVDQLKIMRKIERENEQLRRTIEQDRQQNETNRIYGEWIKQSEEVKEIYPDFDFVEETANSDFSALLRNGIDVRTAYEVIHKDEIMEGAMKMAVQKTKEKVTNDIIANGNRAGENGTSSQAAGTYKKDVNNLTKKDLAEIEKRLARGERISFS